VEHRWNSASHGEVGAYQRTRSQPRTYTQVLYYQMHGCIQTLDGLIPGDKIFALEIFKFAEQPRLFFLNLIDDKYGTAVPWFRAQIAKLT
jgi:hypothetical protein